MGYAPRREGSDSFRVSPSQLSSVVERPKWPSKAHRFDSRLIFSDHLFRFSLTESALLRGRMSEIVLVSE